MKHKSTFTLITAMTVLFSLCMLLLPLGASAQSDIINIPDANFRKYLVKYFDTNKDRKISIVEAAAVKEITLCKEVSSLQGIEYFTGLEMLFCYESNLTSLDVSNNKALKKLFCSGGNLTSLDVSNNTALIDLGFSFPNLTSLDVSNNKALKSLWCGNNKLTSLDVSKNTALIDLRCAYTNLTSLDVSNNTELIELECSYANLTSLDVSNNKALKKLDCKRNPSLTSLDVSNNKALKKLDCQYTPNLTDVYVWVGWDMGECISYNDDGYKKDAHTKFTTPASSRPTLANSSPSSTASTVTTTPESRPTSESTASPQASQESLNKYIQDMITIGDNSKLLAEQAYLGHRNLAAISGNDSYMPIALSTLGQQYNEALKFYKMAADKGSQIAMQRINDLLLSYQRYGMQQPVVGPSERTTLQKTTYEDKCPSCLGFGLKPDFAPYGGRGEREYCNKCGRTDTTHDHDVCTRCNGTGTVSRTRLE